MTLYKRGKTYWADLRAEGLGRQSTGTKIKSEALSRVKALLRGHTRGHTLGEALDRVWEKHYRSSKGSRTVSGQLGWISERYNGVLLENISTPWVRDFTESLNCDTRGAATCNRYLSVLSRTLKEAVLAGWIEYVPVIQWLPETTGRTKVFTDLEVVRMANVFHTLTVTSWMADLMYFLLDTGCRLGEVFKLHEWHRKEAVKSGMLTIIDAKSRSGDRVIPLTARALGMLKENRWADHKQREAQHVWAYARRELGKDGDNEWVMHTLRRTCASRLLELGVDISTIRTWMGHSSIKMTESYAMVGGRTLVAARDSLSTRAVHL